MKRSLYKVLLTLIIAVITAIPSFASDGNGGFSFTNFLIYGITAGVVAVGITVAVVVYNYKKKLQSEKYPLNKYANLDLTDRQDIFTGSFITRRRINRNKK